MEGIQGLGMRETPPCSPNSNQPQGEDQEPLKSQAGHVRILQNDCVCFSDRYPLPAAINKLCCLFVSAPFLSWKEFKKDIKKIRGNEIRREIVSVLIST